MNLKTRFLLLAAILVVAASAAAWGVFQHVAERIIEQWGIRLVEVQVRHDSSRLLRPIGRELALARQMAGSQVLRRWAARPEDPQLRSEAIAEMESFRGNFQDRSYFVALLESGAYYHNNARNEYADAPLRYHLRADNPDDAWFYRIVREQREFHLNVNPDVPLGVTKLWIDVLLRDGERILGVVGTGLELDAIIDDVAAEVQPGITTLFTDHNGAIQLYRDKRYIDFSSIVKQAAEKKTVDLLLDFPADRARLHAMMRSLADDARANGPVLSGFFSVGGKRHLAGIAYLAELDWYEITLLDLDVVMPVSSFGGAALVFAAALLLTLLAVHLALQRLVFGPIHALEAAILKVRDGDLSPPVLPSGTDEIGRLIRHFDAMAGAVRNTTQELEERVRERTEALNRLARVDPLTGLINRRGMTELIEDELARAARQQSCFGIVWIDVDSFKEINDELGHAAGDRALSAVGALLQSHVRPYDSAARWGGDEFLVLLTPCDARTLATLGERIRRAAAESAPLADGRALTLSVGAYLVKPGETVATALQRADEALYAAKNAGRNTFRMIS